MMFAQMRDLLNWVLSRELGNKGEKMVGRMVVHLTGM